MFENEEDVKVKLVYPFLRELGFDESEISFEKSFFLRMGRFTYRVDTEEQREAARSRLDILIKRGGDNICVLEIKRDNVNLSQADVDQAVYYARLVHPIAPFCIITNGKQFRAIDTISKDDLATEEFRQRGGYEVSLPDEKYYEALKYFIGYSKNNLLAFCSWQVETYMRQLRGSVDDRTKKYIEELYQPPVDLGEQLQRFLASTSSAFIVSADSGMGKTCWMCYTALKLLRQNIPTLFYRSGDVVNGVIPSLCQDLNWHLSPQYGEAQATKRFFELFEEVGVVVFIDGIDEADIDQEIEVIGGFLRRVSARNVKLILSCKASATDRILERHGVPTVLSEEIVIPLPRQAYILGQPTDPEFFAMLSRYRTFYRFHGQFEDRVLEDSRRTPFLLRIMFDVASRKGLQHITYSSRDFYEEYFNSMMRQFDQRESTEAVLSSVARILYDGNTEFIDKNKLRTQLGLSVLEEVPPRLFDLNILLQEMGEGMTKVGFYFGQLRNYLIAFKAMKWQTLSKEEFTSQVESAAIDAVRLDAFSLYYTLASEEHKRVLDQSVYDNAYEYVSAYERILDGHFSYLKSAFPPHTRIDADRKENIGLIGYLYLGSREIIYHGFRRIEGDAEKVKLIPITSRGTNLSNLAWLNGASGLTHIGSHQGFRTMDVPKEMWQEIAGYVDEISKSGQLNESNSALLLQERIIATAYEYYRKSLHIEKVSLSKSLPLDLRRIRDAVLFDRALRVLRDESVERKLASGENIPKEGGGGLISYSYTVDDEEQKALAIKARQIADNDEFLESSISYVNIDKMEAGLLSDISCLERLGMTQISEPPIPDWDNRNERSGWINQIKPTTLQAFVEKTYLSYLNEYRDLVEKNLPTLCAHFPFYKKMPLKCFLVFDETLLKTPRGTEMLEPVVHIYHCTNQEGSENRIVSCSSSEITQHAKDPIIYYDKVAYKWFMMSSILFRHFFSAARSYMPVKVDSGLCVLRGLVYGQIRKELRTAFEASLKVEGIQVPRLPYFSA